MFEDGLLDTEPHRRGLAMTEFGAYVGLYVHKDTIAVAHPRREEAVSSCYEAGPSGCGLYRATIETGHHWNTSVPPD